MKTKEKYYVVYTGKDIGYYRTTYWVVCITENEEVAKDLCKKFNYRYTEEVVGTPRKTPYDVKGFMKGKDE